MQSRKVATRRKYTYCVVEDNRTSAYDTSMQHIRIVSEHKSVEEARAALHPCGQHVMQHTQEGDTHSYWFIGPAFKDKETPS